MSQNGKTLWQMTKVWLIGWSTCILKGTYVLYIFTKNKMVMDRHSSIFMRPSWLLGLAWSFKCHKCKLLLRLAIKPKVAIAMPRPPTIFCFVWPHKMWIFAKWMIQLLINQWRFRSLGSINGTAENLKLYNHWLAFTVT